MILQHVVSVLHELGSSRSICLRLCFALFVACVVVAFVAFALFVALFVFRIVVSHCLSHYCVCSHCLWHRLRFAFACVCVSHCCVALFVVFLFSFGVSCMFIVFFVRCWCFKCDWSHLFQASSLCIQQLVTFVIKVAVKFTAQVCSTLVQFDHS